MAAIPSLYSGIGAQIFDSNGDPLSGGKIYTYLGGTTTPIATYTTETADVAHTNPIILDSAGRVPSGGQIWFKEGDSQYYKFKLTSSAEVTIATYDLIPGTYSATALAEPTGASLVGFTGFNAEEGTLDDLADDDGSDWVGFDAGTGATAISVETKLRQIVNVKDFGAVGDGVTEDAASFNAAIDALGGNGGVVIVPSGEYRISTTVELDEGVTIKGEGHSTVILCRTGSTNTDTIDGLFCAKSKESVGIRDMSIKCFPSYNSIRSKFILCDYVQIVNIFVDAEVDVAGDISTYAFWIAGCGNTLIQNCRVYNCRDGVYVCKSNFSTGTSSTRIIVDKCLFENINIGTTHAYPTGVYIYYCDYVIVTNTSFKNINPSIDNSLYAGYGFYEGDGDCTSILIDGCSFFRTNATPALARCDAIFMSYAKFAKVTNCNFEGIAGAYINTTLVGAALVTQVTNCSIKYCDSGIGLQKTGTSTGHVSFLISGNSIHNVTGVGIRVGSGEEVADVAVICDNNVRNSGETGILINLTGDCRVICNNNFILDANTSASVTVPFESGISFYGGPTIAKLSGNVVYNTPNVGFARYGVYKDDIQYLVVIDATNTFSNMLLGSVARPYTARPLTGLWNRGDRVPYWDVSSGGTEGAICTSSLNTSLTAPFTTGTTAITVASGIGTTNGDVIGVTQDDGSTLWTTISSGGGTTSIVLADALTDDAASVNLVWSYSWRNYGVIS